MDMFKILTRGASLKKSKDASFDFSNPNKTKQSKKSTTNIQKEVEKETDFFHQKKHNLLKQVEEAETNDEDPEENSDEDNREEDSETLQKITSEEDAMSLRKSYKGNVTGDDIPLPIGSFEDLISRFKLDKQLLKNLIDNDFTEPTPIQSEAIPSTLFDRDIIACAPTGSGKTLAFLIPLIQKVLQSKKHAKKKSTGGAVKGLVISPTKELALQIFNELNSLNTKLGLSVAYLNKSLSGKLRNGVVKGSKFDIVVSTPLRLIDLVKNGALDLSNVDHLIFDEADKLFDSNFIEQTDAILNACSNNKLRRSIFSATITSSVEELANSIMTSPIRIIIGHKEAANSNIKQKLVFCGDENGKLLAIRQLIQDGEFKPPVIIFLQSITRAKALFHELLYDRLNVDVIHAERTAKQREMIIERFRKGEIWCLICTDVLARGIDFKGINLVINYDVPLSAQAYVHRIGRTGRGGRTGSAVTFYTKEDVNLIKSVVNVMKQSGSTEGLAQWMNDLSKLSKNEKKNLKRKPMERKQISTVPGIVRKKRKMRKEMIVASKKRTIEDKTGKKESSQIETSE
ncbi:unnamed protein product [Ambrosiozyma monospora]|uniref:RNA helicase n=1 Tax=Ambrosiozyma monospora TaxID=43982 RepID=A0A9W6YPD6_AMBMO|nr:unnamed protein product [Ambrosiozyma monospora]